MIELVGEIRNSYRSGGGDVWIIFNAKAGWISSEPVQIVLSKKDAEKILNVEFDNLGNLNKLNHRKITVLIHV